MIVRVLAAGGAGVLSTCVALAQTAKAVLKNAEGTELGSASLTQSEGGVKIRLSLKGLRPGEHAFDVHAVGKCEPPFTAAGGHFNPEGKKPGKMSPDGTHAGDMPNLEIPESGELSSDIGNAAITLDKDKPNSVFRPDGTALAIHAAADDYQADPTGNAGGRIACGVIE